MYSIAAFKKDAYPAVKLAFGIAKFLEKNAYTKAEWGECGNLV